MSFRVDTIRNHFTDHLRGVTGPLKIEITKNHDHALVTVTINGRSISYQDSFPFKVIAAAQLSLKDISPDSEGLGFGKSLQLMARRNVDLGKVIKMSQAGVMQNYDWKIKKYTDRPNEDKGQLVE